MGPYMAALTSFVDAGALAAARPRVVVDPMFGAGSGHLAALLTAVGCDVVEIHVEPHEDFDGIHPAPQDPWADACEQAVVAQGAALGVLLDGDGDRAAVVDEHGSILPARLLVPLVMGHLVEGHGATGRVVTTLTLLGARLSAGSAPWVRDGQRASGLSAHLPGGPRGRRHLRG
jgi:phosphomannomutase